MREWTIGSKGISARVNCTGAMMHSLHDHKNDAWVLYPFFKRGDGKERGGCPICFPAFGSPVPVYEGEKQHGWLRDKVVAVSATENTANALGSRRIGGLYLDKVTFNVIHEVRERAIMSRLQFVCGDKGLGGEKFLFRPGFHPYFPNNGQTKVIIGEKAYQNFNKKAVCVKIDPETPITIYTGKLRIRMILHGFFGSTCIYLWSDDPEKYFCVEPVFSTREDFLEGTQLIATPGTLYDIGMELISED